VWRLRGRRDHDAWKPESPALARRPLVASLSSSAELSCLNLLAVSSRNLVPRVPRTYNRLANPLTACPRLSQRWCPARRPKAGRLKGMGDRNQRFREGSPEGCIPPACDAVDYHLCFRHGAMSEKRPQTFEAAGRARTCNLNQMTLLIDRPTLPKHSDDVEYAVKSRASKTGIAAFQAPAPDMPQGTKTVSLLTLRPMVG